MKWRAATLTPAQPEVAREALHGLFASPKTLPSKLLYDEEGCRLFGDITRLPEYYLTRTECGLLAEASAEIGGLICPHTSLLEYGASDEAKASILLANMAEPAAYIPVDIAATALSRLTGRMRTTFPHLPVHPIASDFLRPIRLPDSLASLNMLGFFPGSTIGNLDPELAQRFLSNARETLGAGARFLVGIDLQKPVDRLLAAYDDAAGVTAAFNRNLLVRLNREAEADFDVMSFRHRAVWNSVHSRVQMHLVSTKAQVVNVGGQNVEFAVDERIHTENSYKYAVDEFAMLAVRAGWRVEHVWSDPRGDFSIQLLG
jgi:L-histidine Nalpha-methyltransferase